MKRKLFMIAIAAVSMCVMAGCGSKDSSKEKNGTEQVTEGGEADSNAKEEVVAMINSIFDIDIDYSTASEAEIETYFDLIIRFGSKRLCNLVEQVREIDADKAEEDHFIADWNWLLSCWDLGVSRVEDIEATVDGNTAKVKYWVYYSSQHALYELALVREDGQWRVDDILTMGSQTGSKVEQMTKYIKENR